MATPFPFTSGQVLTAAQMNAITTLPINDQTANYTLVVGDVGKRVIMNVSTASTVTVNNNVFAAGDTIFIANKASNASVITAGVGVSINTSGSLSLAQHGGGTLVALSASTFTFFPAGSVTTLDVDFLLVGGGGGGGHGVAASDGGGGGGAGGFVTGSGIIGKDTYTVKVGASGAGAASATDSAKNGTASSFIGSANGGGGGGNRDGNGNVGGSGGGRGADSTAAVATGISGEGNDGGTSTSTGAGGGGGGAGGVGGNASGSTGGAGGTASTNNYTGSSISYSGGGGGGGATGGTAGTNAGNGGSNAGGSNGTANRGGGGGGGGAANIGGNGGSGQVVIRYLTADAAAFTITTTGTVTSGTDGSYTFKRFDSTGTLVVA